MCIVDDYLQYFEKKKESKNETELLPLQFDVPVVSSKAFRIFLTQLHY